MVVRLFGNNRQVKEIINRDAESERRRRIDNAGNVLNFLFPSGGDKNRKNTMLYKRYMMVKQRLKENPIMTGILASILAGGAAGSAYAFKKGHVSFRSRKRRSTKRRSTKRRSTKRRKSRF